MKRLVLASVVGVALAASLWLWLWLWFGREPAHVPAPAGPGPSLAAGEGSPRRAADRPAVPDREAVASIEPTLESADAPAALEVLVLRLEDDQPLEGVEVVARAERDDQTLELTGLTDAGGRCRLEHRSSFVAWSAQVRPTATTSGESRWLDRVRIEAGATMRTTLRVSGGGSLVGRVVDGQGAPVAGARVLGWCSSRYVATRPPDREAVSDEGGRFELAHLGSDFLLVAEKEGLGCAQGLRGELAPGAHAEGGLEIVLRAMRTVRGRVLGARGEPLQARLTIEEVGHGGSADATGVIGVERFRPVAGEAASDAQGVFALGPVPQGRWNVRFDEPEHLLVRMRMPADDGEWLVRLQPGGGVRGVVLSSDGEPLEGAEVGLHAGPEEEGWFSVDTPQVLRGTWRTTRSAQDGRFSVGGVASGEGAMLKVSAPGHAPWLREDLELRPGALLDLQVHLEGGLPLAGRVVERDGAPVAGAQVQLEGDRTWARDYSTDVPATWEHLFDRGRTYTDGQGRFRFEDLYAGRFGVRAHLPGDERLFSDAVGHAGDEQLEIVLDRPAMERVVLAGRVVDRRTGEPLRAFTVTPMVWHGSEANGRGTEVVDDDGRFRIAGLEPGRIELNVRAPGYATWRDEPQELGLGVHRFEVRLAALRSVELRLLQIDGQPYEGLATARFSRPTGEEVWVQRNRSASDRTGLRRGVAEGLQLPAELLQVAFDLHDGEPELVFDLDLERDPSEVFEFRVEPRVEGEPFTVQAMVFSVAPGFDASGLEQQLRLQRGGIDHPECGPPGVEVRLIGRNARGVGLLVGALTPVEAGFRERWAWPGEGRSSEGTLPLCAFRVQVPGRVATLTVEAQGHEPLELSLDPRADNGGVDPLLVLRRR